MRFVIWSLKISIVVSFCCALLEAQPCPKKDCYSIENEKKQLATIGVRDVKKLTRAIRLSPANADLYYRRGEYYRLMYEVFGETVTYRNVVLESDTRAKAFADLERAIALKPRADYFVTRGYLYQRIWERELDDAKIREKAFSGKSISWQDVETFLVKNQWFEKAEKDYLAAVSLEKRDYNRQAVQNHFLRNLYNRILYLVETEDKWSRSLTKSFVENRKQSVLLAFLDKYIRFYRAKIGTRDEKENDLAELTELYIRKGVIASRLGAYKIANESFEQQWRQPPVSFSADLINFEWGRTLANLNQLDGAISRVEAVAGQNKGNRFNVFLGDLYLMRGDYRTAIAKYTKRIEQYETGAYQNYFEDAFFKRGKAYLETGETEKAAADFSLAIVENKQCPQYFVFRARALRVLGKVDLASADEQTSAELEKNPAAVVCRLEF